MKVLSKLVLASMVIATSCGAPQKAPRSRMSTKDIVIASKPAIVRVEVEPDRVGTGFVIDSAGLIATNLHVVFDADDITVTMLDGTKHKVMRIVGWDMPHDLAILDIDPPGPLPTLKLGDSDSASAGDAVIAIGNPLGVLDYTVSDGLLSAVRLIEGETYLQISAPISQGSSGGPVFNAYGEVIGVVSAFLGGGQNLNFAIPVKYLKTLVATAAAPQTPAQFKEQTAKLIEEARGRIVLDSGIGIPEDKIPRKVPNHDVKIFTGCKREDVADTFEAIRKAISIGAPLYNEGLKLQDEAKIEMCFRVYEQIVAAYERMSPCPGVRSAFGDGLQRAETMKTAKEKAWALRDTFDGMQGAIERWVGAQP